MAEIPRFIVDASIVTKWHLRDENLVQETLTVNNDLLADRVELLAPSAMRHEVVRAILNAARNPQRPQITREGGRLALEAFLGWPIAYVPDDLLIPHAYGLAERLGVSYFDSLYLALVEETATPFIHADQKLRRALGQRFPLALWIEDYQA